MSAKTHAMHKRKSTYHIVCECDVPYYKDSFLNLKEHICRSIVALFSSFYKCIYCILYTPIQMCSPN